MIALILYIFFFAVISLVGVLSGLSDYKGLRIPNWHSLAVIFCFVLSYVFMSLMGREDVFFGLWSHIISAGVVFLVTLSMFALGGLGAGDSKLATAYALWVGVRGLMPFLFYMALIGGVLAVLALILRKYKPFKNPPEGGWIERVQAGESKVPYGIAIVGGVLVSFVKIGYFDMDVLASFVL